MTQVIGIGEIGCIPLTSQYAHVIVQRLQLSTFGRGHRHSAKSRTTLRRMKAMCCSGSQEKSNRDASEIMNISARTVNKHLEQVFIKLGVENRAAAALIATRIIALQSQII
jgi:DNA-binding CsgD family transcriptional regulator